MPKYEDIKNMGCPTIVINSSFYKYNDYIIPNVGNKEILLYYVLPFLPEDLLKKSCNDIENRKGIGWIKDKESEKIFKEFCENRSSIIKYYNNPDIIKGLYSLACMQKELNNKKFNIKDSIIYYECKHTKIYINPTESIKYLENINNNIEFWKSILDKKEINKKMEELCEKEDNYYLEKLNSYREK
ncbi:hypothetical protein YN1_1370 [Nanoarchaeota archaeon]